MAEGNNINGPILNKYFDMCDNDYVANRIDIPLPKYEEYCPKCFKPRKTEWESRDDLKGCFMKNMRVPLECSGGCGWWIPCNKKIYTTEQIKALMLTKTQNERGHQYLGHDENNEPIYKRDDWRLYTLTREEYFGAEACKRAVIAAAKKQIEDIREISRDVINKANKFLRIMEPKKKKVASGGKGKTKKKK